MERKEAIDSLVKAVQERNYGDVLSYDEIGNIINVKRDSMYFQDILQAARKRLETSGHMIVNVRGIGYKVCYPDNYTGESMRHMGRAGREINRCAKILNHAPVNDMAPAAREAHNRVRDRMRLLQASVAGASVEIHMLSASNNPLLTAK